MGKKRIFLLGAHTMLCWLVVLGFLYGCSTSDSKVGGDAITPPSLQNPGAQEAQAHSPSAMEALSRGMAVVTPPGAPLKDIYFDFDQTDLRADARDILKKNAEWMKNHPAAKVEIEGHC
ncbi:MAG TPA: hypothetical protein VE131_12625, partial [Terriglobales bacterium]|nr:hypothetical protein [Terriglobales bacterium]